MSLFVFSSVAGSKSRRMFVAHLPPDAQNHHVMYKSGTQTDIQDIPLTLLQVREGKSQH